MNRRWQSLRDNFAEQPRDRRLLIALAVCLLATLPLLSYAILPDWQQQQQLQQQLMNTQQQIGQVTSANQQLQQQLRADVNQPVLKKIDRYRQQLGKLEQEANQFSLLDVDERRAFFDAALSYPDTVELVTLASESPQMITEDNEANAKSADSAVNLYRHVIKAEYSGSYNDLKYFFAELRQQHSAVNWDYFRYQVTEYPTAAVSIRWTLLSTDKEIIGG